MKRRMSFATGIVAIVFGALSIVGGALIFGLSFVAARHQWRDWFGALQTEWDGAILGVMISIGLIIVAVSIVQVIIGAQLVRRTRYFDMTPQSFNAPLIFLLVLSFFSGGLILLGLSIASLCMNNTEDVLTCGTQNKSPSQTAKSNQSNEFEAAIMRLKQYKSDGIIDEKVFKQKMEELFAKHYMQ